MATIAVDWDGTCVEHQFSEMGDWLPGAVEALRKLSSRADVIVHSCRVQFEGPAPVRAALDSVGLQRVKIWEGQGKPIAFLYVDDRGFTFRDWVTDLPAVLDLLHSHNVASAVIR